MGTLVVMFVEFWAAFDLVEGGDIDNEEQRGERGIGEKGGGDNERDEEQCEIGRGDGGGFLNSE